MLKETLYVSTSWLLFGIETFLVIHMHNIVFKKGPSQTQLMLFINKNINSTLQ